MLNACVSNLYLYSIHIYYYILYIYTLIVLAHLTRYCYRAGYSNYDDEYCCDITYVVVLGLCLIVFARAPHYIIASIAVLHRIITLICHARKINKSIIYLYFKHIYFSLLYYIFLTFIKIVCFQHYLFVVNVVVKCVRTQKIQVIIIYYQIARA